VAKLADWLASERGIDLPARATQPMLVRAAS
jgi:hypothetical protein